MIIGLLAGLLVCFSKMQLEDGDIICFQKAPAMDSEEHVRYPDVPSYLEYVHNRQVISSWGSTKEICFVCDAKNKVTDLLCDAVMLESFYFPLFLCAHACIMCNK